MTDRRGQQMIKETPGTFRFGDYHFVPYRQFRKGETKRPLKGDSRPWKIDAQYEMRNIRSDRELGLSKYDWKKSEYSHEKFYEASGDSKCDIFRCIENGKLYVPAENEIFQYNEPKQRTKTGVKKPTLQEKLDNARQHLKEENAKHDGNRGAQPKKRDERE